eukprot:scpid50674/ scgid21733/ 
MHWTGRHATAVHCALCPVLAAIYYCSLDHLHHDIISGCTSTVRQTMVFYTLLSSPELYYECDHQRSLPLPHTLRMARSVGKECVLCVLPRLPLSAYSPAALTNILKLVQYASPLKGGVFLALFSRLLYKTNRSVCVFELTLSVFELTLSNGDDLV